MTFISYAQNAEDVMLYRALRDVQHGFYIDVGAQDPVEDSVTQAFYERGWRGINIEPVKHWYERLAQQRPHDINLHVAVSDAPGELRLFEVENTGLSTTDETFAGRHRAQGLAVNEHRVACVTLDSICAEQNVQTVHFLKVDCEGAEEQALRGMPLDRVRPWIVMVEASEPNSTTPTHDRWEHLVTKHGYDFVFTEGINRYYLAREHRELREAFARPVNVLDDWQRASEAGAHRRVRELHEELLQVRSIEQRTHIQAARDEWQRNADRWRERGEQARSELAERGRELSRLQGEVAGFYAERAEITKIHADLRQELADRVRQARDMEREIGRLQGELTGFGDERAALEHVHAGLRQELADRVRQARDMEREIGRLQADIAHMGERHEREIRTRQVEVDQHLETLRAHQDEFEQAHARLNAEVFRLQSEIRGQGEEVSRLQNEYREIAAERDRLRTAFEQIRTSHSWALTRPLRVLRRGFQGPTLKRLIKSGLRPAARKMRPHLRRVADNPRLRAMCLRVVGGRESAIARRLRRFLIGPPAVTPPLHQIARVGDEFDSRVYSRRERMALAPLQRALPPEPDHGN